MFVLLDRHFYKTLALNVAARASLVPKIVAPLVAQVGSCLAAAPIR